MIKWFFFLALFISLTTQAMAGPKPDISKLKSHEIALSARPIHFGSNANVKVFGNLVFRSGFIVSSPSAYWGGLSGIAISKDGAQVALVSDAGFWARLNLAYANNRLQPPKKALVGPLKALGNKPLKLGRDRDAEAITLLKSDKFFGQALISFEGNHRIGRFSLDKKGVKGPKSYLRYPFLRRLSGNAGIEAMAVVRKGKLKGSLVAIAQSRKDKRGNFIGWLIRKGKITKIRFTPPQLDKYRITDAVGLPNGDLLLLERRYKFLTINMRVRYVTQKELRSGRPIKGNVIMEANSNSHQVDNMEGIAVHKNKQGETIVTLISDDNFNGFQKTLLMQFALMTHGKSAAR